MGWWTAILLLVLLTIPTIVKYFLVFLILPLRMRKQTLSATLEWIGTRAEDLTPEMRDYLAPLLRAFGAGGFQVVANLKRANDVPGVIGFQIVLVNRASGDTAAVLLTQAGPNRTFVFFVRSRFSDGRELVTGVNKGTGIFPKDPLVDSITFPWVTDVACLCEAHRRRLSDAGRKQEQKITPSPGEERSFIETQMQRERERLVQIRYYVLDAPGGCYRKTIKGTYLTTWRSLPRIRAWRIRRRDRDSLRIWKQLKMDQWVRDHPSAVEVPPRSISVDDASPPREASLHESLPYEPALGDEELRQLQRGESLTLRMGQPSVSDYLFAQWLNLLPFVFCLLCLMNLGPALWSHYRFITTLPPPLRGMYGISPAVLVTLGIIFLSMVSQGYWLFRGIGRFGGTTVVIVGPGAIQFDNAPVGLRHGEISRDDLQSLRVRRHRGTLFRPMYKLEASLRSSRLRQTLFMSRDAKKLLELQTAIVQSIGITSEAIPAVPAAR